MNFTMFYPLSTEQSLLAVCAIALVTHQIFKRLETYSLAAHIVLLCTGPLMGFALLRHTIPIVRALWLSFATFISTMLVSITIYRLSPFHPLARYPGPLGCKLSKFWLAFIASRGNQHLYLKSLHERYGDVVRIGPNELSFRDSSILNAMLGVGGIPKGPLVVGRTLNAEDLPLVGIADPAVHTERRKPWIRALSTAAVKEYEPMIAHRTTQLVQAFERQSGEVMISDFFNYFSFDFMCDMAFGGGSNVLRDGDTNDVRHILEDGMPVASFFGHLPWLAVHCGRLPIFTAAAGPILEFSKKFAAARLERGSVTKDIFHYLNNEDQPDKPPPPMKQLLDDGILAIIAGSDTTSSALTSLVFCLLTHPPTLKRIQAEIDQFYPAGESPCDPKHHRDMHYLTAAINEALRLYPPVPSGTHRRVPHRGQGVMLGPYYAPPGTAMYLHPYSLHRDGRNFSPFPEDFWPERWLVAAGRISLSEALNGRAHGNLKADATTFTHNAMAFIPFSYGPANCIGKQLAMQEMRTVACAVLQKFEIRLRHGWDLSEFDRNFEDHYVTKRPPLPVTLRARF
ncbi:high nitrogen upregulated cytochrome P450 monooxygenase 2 [Trametes punicea]|nr:high nitrogen upregulated cytochrome P450 monooxygenase 2 [Trametes punicea]